MRKFYIATVSLSALLLLATSCSKSSYPEDEDMLLTQDLINNENTESDSGYTVAPWEQTDTIHGIAYPS